MVILGGLGNVWGVIVGGVLMGSFNLILAEDATSFLRNLGYGLGLPFLQNADLQSSKFMIYGLALVLMMVLRPAGLFPSRERLAELREGVGGQGSGIGESEAVEMPEVRPVAID